jgi:UMF1 family MFS transporter
MFRGALQSSGTSPSEAAWSLTEAANEPFFTLVQRYVFPPFFVGTLAASAGPAGGAATWGYMTAAAGAMVAIGAPLMGAVADSGGRRRPFMLAMAALAFATALPLFWAAPGRSLLLIIPAAVIAMAAFELLAVATNSFLPLVARRDRLGILSGLAFGFGQLAGICALLLAMALSETKLPPLAAIPHLAERLAGPIAAFAMLMLLLPAVLFLRDPPEASRPYNLPAAVAGLHATLKAAWADRTLRLFFLGRAVGGDGLSLVFAFGAVLAGQTFGWKAGTLAGFGVAVTLASAAGGFAAALFDRRLGARRTVVFGLSAVLAGLGGLLAVGPEHILGVQTGVPLSHPFASPQEQLFVAAALLVAVGAGPALSGMRALMAAIAPPEQVSACFGLYALVGKATNFVGPLLLGLVISATGSLRLGLGTAALFLVAGIACFLAMPAGRSRPA